MDHVNLTEFAINASIAEMTKFAPFRNVDYNIPNNNLMSLERENNNIIM